MSSKVTRGAFAVLGMIGLLLAGNPAAGEEEEAPTPMKMRNYDHFEFDTTVGSYFGIAMFYTEDDRVTFNSDPGIGDEDFAPTRTDNQIVTGEIRLTMGGETIQGGVAIPYHNTKGDALSGGADDIGDVRAHVKIVPLRKDLFDLGGGLVMTFPGGSEDRGITTGNVGTIPFVTGTVHAGPVDLNTHIGYQFYNHQDSNGSPESIVYGSTLFFPATDLLGLRLELAGQSFTSGENRNVVAIQPGFDVFFDLGKIDMQFTAAGSYTPTGGTAGSETRYASRWGVNTISGLSRGQWGIGAAIAALWN